MGRQRDNLHRKERVSGAMNCQWLPIGICLSVAVQAITRASGWDRSKCIGRCDVLAVGRTDPLHESGEHKV